MRKHHLLKIHAWIDLTQGFALEIKKKMLVYLEYHA
jgi:hypothetical protein